MRGYFAFPSVSLGKSILRSLSHTSLLENIILKKKLSHD